MKINFQSLRNINKTWLSLGVALAIGLLTALGARTFLSRQVEAIEARAKHDTADIVVAKTEIAAGSKLGRENLAVRKVPVDFAQSGAVRPEDFARIDGKAIAYDVKSGEMIMWSQMESQRAPTFSARLAPGQRAITVVVDEINSISGMLEPGDLIDLMFSVDQNGQKMVLPLLQSVQVMATGQRVVDDLKSGEKTQFATVTLNATPEQAKDIIIARETGRLTALLRNPNDKDRKEEPRPGLSVRRTACRGSARTAGGACAVRRQWREVLARCPAPRSLPSAAVRPGRRIARDCRRAIRHGRDDPAASPIAPNQAATDAGHAHCSSPIAVLDESDEP
jgi:pilus assembly protein CpaB